ncbi:hypothetical protein JXM67_07770 [candidate division WOR-3 bacterium]|nr:hypothetical protein [candidate division WOR-3 bacterium]
MRLLVTGLGILTLAFTALSCARKPVKLRWKLEAGKTYAFRAEVTGSWRIEGWEQGERGGDYGKLFTSEMMILAIEEDSSFSVQETIELIREGKKFKPTVVVYRMSPNGKIYGIESLEADTATQVFASQERREQFLEQTQPTYPDRELAKGDNWVQETKVVLDDRVIAATNEFEVKDWEKVEDYMCLRIDYKGQMVVPHKKGEAQLLDKGAAHGSIWFAPEQGLLIQQIDSVTVATTRVMPEGEETPATYIVEYVHIYQLEEIE